MLENLKEIIRYKSYNWFGNLVLMLFYVAASMCIGSGLAAYIMNASNLRCNPDKNLARSEKAYVETSCSLQYEQKYQLPVPLCVFVFLNFGIVILLCNFYAYGVKSRIESLDRSSDRSTTTDDDAGLQLHEALIEQESQSNQENRPNYCIPVFYAYIFHLLFGRALPMILFAVLVFYPANFPTEFFCRLPPSNLSIPEFASGRHFTTVECKSTLGSKNSSLAKAIWILDIIFSLVSVAETVHLVWKKWIKKDYPNDIEFCRVYLLRKRKTCKIKELISERIEEIISNYKNGLENTKLFKIQYGLNETLDEMYVKLIIQPGRENQMNSKERRHEMYDAYLKHPDKCFEEIEDLFHSSGNLPRRILVVGRPGIGKSILTKKILLNWKRGVHEFYGGKLLILLQFRTFNAEEYKMTTLKDMIRIGTSLPAGGDLEILYKYILNNPKKIIIIFDGLDELKTDSDCLTNAERATNDYKESKPIFTIFYKLIHGNFLAGATVITTSRPTVDYVYGELQFDRQVEILGFSKVEIHNYVMKFCKVDTVLSDSIWNLIQYSAELLSLCYIPISCFIVCFTLKTCIEQETCVSSVNKVLPRTLTKLYQKAMRAILWNHHPACKGQPIRPEYLNSNEFLPAEVLCTLDELKRLAKNGMEKGELIFELKTKQTLEMENCGLLNRLPNDAQYCFTHLTIQEFLAAWHVVDETNDPQGVEHFLKSHINDSSWHLIIQFFAGLLRDKIEEIINFKYTFEEMYKRYVG